MSDNKKHHFSSGWGFVLSAVGSAVGAAEGVAVASGVGAGLGAQAESRESPKARAKRRLYRMVDVPFRFRFPIQSTILIHRCQERVTF